MSVYRYVGRDGNGIIRVWGEGRSDYDAVKECETAAMEYVARRPDTGPLADWSVIWESIASVNGA